MLEIRNITKVYRSKTGESVKALDNISISFPESGMVFLLGKSGSGKSTLLNVIGGLDSCDEGEFIIKGKSSRDFHGSDFDAYRNTFIGFIFQEYNILDDFSVGANIGLALELQGKKATGDKISAILSEVDLENFAKRKPNELSGGQKQRVAIARALVKEPEIIMADEPTGALDSNTGKQIFDTLKKLSEKKLVIIVSHDRDFAEKYADRIIELSDGQIISDVTKHERPGQKISAGVDRISHNLFKIRRGYKLTEDDISIINKYIEDNDCDIILSGDGRVNGELRSAAGITESGGTNVFESTDPASDIELLEYDGKKTRFIHSRLPLKNAVRIGSSGLKHKKFRLVMTVLLSLVAFSLFGLADTMAAYEKIQSATDSLIDSNVKNATFSLGVANYYYFDGELQDKYFQADGLNDADIKFLSNKTGLDFVPVFTGSVDEWSSGFTIAENYITYSSNNVFNGKLAGVTSLDSDRLERSGLSLLAGKLPEASGEIAISELILRSFKEFGFKNSDKNEEIAADKINSPSDLLGKHITLGTQSYGIKNTYKIVGVIETGFDYQRYQSFLPSDVPAEGGLADMVLLNELSNDLNYGFHALGLLTNDDVIELSESMPIRHEPLGEYMSGWGTEPFLSYKYLIDEENENTLTFNRIGNDELLSKLEIQWIGNPQSKLEANEVIVPSSFINHVLPDTATLDVPLSDFADHIYSLYKIDINKYLENGTYSYMELAYAAGNEYYLSQEIYDFDVNRDVFPYLLKLLGIEDIFPSLPPVSYASEIYNNMYILSNIYTDTQKLELSQSSISELLTKAYDIRDFYASKLYSDSEYIQKVMEYQGINENVWQEYSENDRQQIAFNAYAQMYKHEHPEYVSYDYDDLYSKARLILLELEGTSLEELLSGIQIDRMERDYQLNTESLIESYSLNVVGFMPEDKNYDVYGLVISNKIYDDYKAWYAAEMEENYGGSTSEWKVADHESGVWAFAIAPITQDRELVENLVTLSYDDSGDIIYSMENSVMVTLNSFNSFIEIGAQIFLYVGIGFAVFSALLLMNFIATSISYKKREIGILRAVGARSSDVFKIFFSEALIIALINFVLSVAVVLAATIGINSWMRSEGIRITLLNLGVRQIALMLIISIAVALLASFLPVNRIARRKPVDAIKDK